MPTIPYVAFLRGINVGGHTVKMDRLRQFCGDLGFAGVRSYIQSGNVFFESDQADKPALQAMIERHLQTALGYKVPTALRTISELEQVLALDPFRGIPVTPDIRLAVTFLAEPVAVPLSVPYLTPDGAFELREMTTTELFVVWHLQEGRPGNSYGLLEKKVAVAGTTRFWHTTAKILAAAKG
jgi:uncharacterized protein (DUF1697 family)